ncbi:hypothetical protein B0H13DRAFT_2325229 [Mycena leptocephala]|nr:hypothetical protein B0H13DRAFT_2325229 [Mycena leptocephala]
MPMVSLEDRNAGGERVRNHLYMAPLLHSEHATRLPDGDHLSHMPLDHEYSPDSKPWRLRILFVSLIPNILPNSPSLLSTTPNGWFSIVAAPLELLVLQLGCLLLPSEFRPLTPTLTLAICIVHSCSIACIKLQVPPGAFAPTLLRSYHLYHPHAHHP